MSEAPVLVELLRGPLVESAHRGSLVVVDGEGALVRSLGEIDAQVYPRSAVKLLQALPLVASGAADRFALTDDELALACASHNGEPEHVRVAAGLLAKLGLDEQALECGTHWPLLDTAGRALAGAGEPAGPLHNNCSGKHAGFLCVGCLLAEQQRRGDARAFVEGYVQPGHPVMREVTAALQASTGCDLADAPRGTDGCSIPTYGIPLRRLALAFARVASGIGLPSELAVASRRLRQAVARSPFMVGGSGRFDSVVMQRLGERACCKVGAEGVYCAALPEAGLGVALKIADGQGARAAEVAMAAAIEALVELDDGDAQLMRSFSDHPLHNWNGIEVGRLRASALLRGALPPRR